VKEPSALLIFGLLIFLISYSLVFGIRNFALRFGLQDVPNDRSSHHTPMPRGGGLAVVLLVIVVTLIGALLKEIPYVLAACLGCGLPVALVGMIDDIRHLSAKSRIIVHLFSATGVASFICISAASRLNSVPITAILLGALIIFYLAWMTNLYNFMDGIDGIASTQGITVTMITMTIAFQKGNFPLGLVALVLSSALLGFIIHNWHPARIFMGDVCSGFLGFTFGVLALWGALDNTIPFPTALILMGAFIVDATYTLLRRLLRGELVYQAHRLHSYQKLARIGHSRVCLALAALNILWLAPAAYSSMKFPEHSWLILLGSYVPLVALAYLVKAGIPEDREWS